MNTSRSDLLITGSGSLATGLIEALSLQIREPRKIIVAARDLSRITWLCTCAHARARTVGNDVEFIPQGIDWNREESIQMLLHAHRPGVIIHLASLQSPWRLKDESEWSGLVTKYGFGSTTPLQAELLLRLLVVVRKENSDTLVINGCYPDVCNHLMGKLGFKVFCGIGNVAILDAVVKHRLKLVPSQKLQMIAHHYHVSQLISKRSVFPEAWLDREFVDLKPLLSDVVLPSDASLNSVTSVTIVSLLLKILRGESGYFNLPGPLALPGGYPVKLSSGALQLDLPQGIELEEVVQRNEMFGNLEGVHIGKDFIGVHPEVARYLRSVCADFTLAKYLAIENLEASTIKNSL